MVKRTSPYAISNETTGINEGQLSAAFKGKKAPPIKFAGLRLLLACSLIVRTPEVIGVAEQIKKRSCSCSGEIDSLGGH